MIGRPITSAITTVYSGRTYIGCVLNRGRDGDANEQSRGLHKTLREAAGRCLPYLTERYSDVYPTQCPIRQNYPTPWPI